MSELLFKVAADTASAASSLKRLMAPLAGIKKQSDAASKSLDKIGKSDVTPKVNTTALTRAISTAQTRLADLRSQLVKEVTLGVDTKATQREIRKVEADLRTLQKANKPIPVTVDTKGVVAAFDRARASRDKFFASLKQKTGITALSGIKSSLSDIGGVLGAASAKVGSFASGVGSAFKAISVPVLGTALAGVTALAAGITVLGIKTLTLADQFERAKIQMNSFTRNGGKTNRLLAQIQKFADKTPFEFPELQKSATRLLGLGIPLGKIVPQLKQIGDIAAQSGASVDDLTTIFAQMTATGRVNAEDMNQLADRGIAAWPKLAKAMGMSVAEVRKLSEEGKLGRKEIALLWDTLGDGAKGATKDLSNTLSGQISTLKDTVNGILRRIGEGLLPLAKVIVPQVTKGAKGIGDAIVKALPGIIRVIGQIGEALSKIPGDFLRAMGAVAFGLGNMFAGLQTSIADIIDAIALALSSLPKIFNIDTSGLTEAAQNIRDSAVKTGQAGADSLKGFEDAAKRVDKALLPVGKKFRAVADSTAFKFEIQANTDDLKKKYDKAKKALEKDPTNVKLQVKADDAKKAYKESKAFLDLLNDYTAKPKLLDQDVKKGLVSIKNGYVELTKKGEKALKVKVDTKDGTDKLKGLKDFSDALVLKPHKAKVDADKTAFDRQMAAADAQLAAWGKAHESATLDANGKPVTSAVNSAEKKIVQFGKKKATASLFANNSNVNRETDQASGWVNTFDKKSATATLKADNSNVLSEVAQAQRAINSLHGKTVTVRTRRETVDVRSSPSPAAASSSASMPTIELHVRDEALADFIDVRVNGQAVRASRVLRRKDLVKV